MRSHIKVFKIKMMVIACVLGLTVSSRGFSEEAAPLANKSLKAGQPIPWLAGWTVDGQVMNLRHMLKRDHKFNVLIVSASWCEACKVCLMKIKPQRSQFDAKKVGIFAVDFMEDAETAKEYLSQFGFSVDSIILDQFGSIANSLGVMRSEKAKSEVAALPLTVVFDKQGKVTEVVEGCPDSYLKGVLGV